MNMRSLVAVALLAAPFAAACGGADMQASATMPSAPSANVSVTAPAMAAPVAGAFVITPANSKVEWTGSKVSAHHDGSFTAFAGLIEIPGAIEAGKVSVDIDTASLAVNDPSLGPMQDKLAGHLKSPDFFDVAKFPKANFTSTSIKANGATYTIAGNLTLHGATKPITFPATIAANGGKLDVSATFDINRKDFGLNYPGKPDDLIKDNVAVRLTIHADKK